MCNILTDYLRYNNIIFIILILYVIYIYCVIILTFFKIKKTVAFKMTLTIFSDKIMFLPNYYKRLLKELELKITLYY